MKLLKQTQFDKCVYSHISFIRGRVDSDVFYTREIENIETERRDGYSPHSHNQGGYKLTCFADLGGMYGSGNHNSTYASSFIDSLIERDIKSTNENIDKNLTDDERLDKEYESLSQDENSVYLELTMMFSDKDERGVYSLEVNAYLEGSDAPYHRGYDFSFETTLRFKTAKSLRRQLKALGPKLEKFMWCRKSKVGDFEENMSRSIYGYNIKPVRETETVGA